MRLAFLVPNQAWVFLFGDQIIEMGDYGRFFTSRADAVEAAGQQGLSISRTGAVS